MERQCGHERGSTDAVVFENFIRHLSQYNGRRKPNSVLIMDNASFHRPERITEPATILTRLELY
jgi:hypothetical protein